MQEDFNKIDKLARENLEKYEVDFNREDWLLMEKKLDKKEHLMPYIWLYKGIEASMLLLIVLTFFNLWFNTDHNKGVYTDVINQNKQTKIAFIDNIKTDINRDIISGKITYDQQKEINNSAKIPVNKYDQNNLLTDHKNTVNQNFNNKSNTISISNSKDVIENNKNLNLAYDDSNKKIDKDNLINFADLSNNSLDVLNYNKLEFEGPGDGVEEGEGFNLKNKFKFPKLHHRELRAVIFAAPDMNFSKEMGNSNLGLSLGVLFENEISNRFSLRYGIVSSRKSFEDNFVKIIDRTQNDGIVYESKVDMKTKLSVFSVPVFLNTIIYRDEKWRMSMSTGAAFSLLTHRFVSGTQRTSQFQQSGAVTAISDLNSSNFEKGFVQGGDFNKNFYSSLAIGFEVERQLGSQVTLFVQPMFMYAMTSFSEDKHKVHQLSLNVGIKGILK